MLSSLSCMHACMHAWPGSCSFATKRRNLSSYFPCINIIIVLCVCYYLKLVLLCLVPLIRFGQAIWVLQKTEWRWEFPLATDQPTIVIRVTLHTVLTSWSTCSCYNYYSTEAKKVTHRRLQAHVRVFLQLGRWQSAC